MTPKKKPDKRKTLPLTKRIIYDIPISKMNGYSTAQAAGIIGVSKTTILAWLRQGLLKEPERGNIGGVEWRVWSQADIERAREVKSKTRPGPKRKVSQ